MFGSQDGVYSQGFFSVKDIGEMETMSNLTTLTMEDGMRGLMHYAGTKVVAESERV